MEDHRELRYDVGASVREIAKKLAITSRMAEYRIGKLLERDAVQVRAIIDAKKQSGIVFFEIEFTVPEGMQSALASKLTQQFGDRVWSTQSLKGGVILSSFFGFSLGETEDASFACSRLENVRSTALFALKEMVEPKQPNWIDGLVEPQASGENPGAV